MHFDKTNLAAVCDPDVYRYGNLDVSHIHGPSRPVTGIALLLYMQMTIVPLRKHLWTSAACYGNGFTSVYVDDVCSSKERHLWTSTGCYRDSFTFLYVDDARTSQETPIDCYGDIFNFSS
jgi:hypothetical protein